eukprot:1788740-Rhodomonas_salina.1
MKEEQSRQPRQSGASRMWTTVVMEGVRREVRVALSAPFGSKCNWDGWKQCYELEQTKGNYVADHESH